MVREHRRAPEGIYRRLVYALIFNGFLCGGLTSQITAEQLVRLEKDLDQFFRKNHHKNSMVPSFSHDFRELLSYVREYPKTNSQDKLWPHMGLSENVGLIFPMIASHLKTGLSDQQNQY